MHSLSDWHIGGDGGNEIGNQYDTAATPIRNGVNRIK